MTLLLDFYKVDMVSNKEISKVDGFRFLNHLHTTARQLRICSQITLELNNSQKLRISLRDSLINWSLKKEENNIQYLNSKGKLTNKKKTTTAFEHYLDLCKSLGLINDFNGLFANSRLSYILIHFLSKRDFDFELGQAEKYFYLYLLLMNDADGLFLVLNMLAKEENNQQSLQNIFRESLNDRLIIKSNLSSNYVKATINEKYRSINYIWRKPEKYAEHLLIPRCEWLNQLGLVSIEKLKGSTFYSISGKGNTMLDLLPRLINTDLVDMDEDWMLDNIFTIFPKVYPEDFSCKVDYYGDQFITYLGQSIEKAIGVVKSSNLFRIPFFDSLLFVCLDMLVVNNIVVNFSDINKLLTNGLTFNGRLYLMKTFGRVNESYITTRPAL